MIVVLMKKIIHTVLVEKTLKNKWNKDFWGSVVINCDSRQKLHRIFPRRNYAANA